VEEVEQWLETYPNCRLIVINRLKQVAYSLAIFLLHHNRKAPGDDSVMNPSGRTGITVLVDNLRAMKRKRGTPYATMC
jgi:hypothetical protein